MVKLIRAKSILHRSDGWFGAKYGMNIYRGCEHRCVYCDSRSDCYGISDFDHELLVKENAIELLEDELSRKRTKCTICFGAMTDPYTPSEAKYKLTAQALELMARFGFSVNITTKSDLVVRDVDILKRIGKATVSFTITTTDDDLARKIEPNAPPPSRRLAAMSKLSGAGIRVGVTMMPILPFIEDAPESILSIIHRAHECGAKYIMPWIAVSMRDGSREFLLDHLEFNFPGMKAIYQREFDKQYECKARNSKQLYRLFNDECARLGIIHRMEDLNPPSPPAQMELF